MRLKVRESDLFERSCFGNLVVKIDNYHLCTSLDMSRYSSVLTELQTAKARLAELEQKREERTAQLRALPAKFGYENLNAFIKALRANAASNGTSSASTEYYARGLAQREALKQAEPAKGMSKAASVEVEAGQTSSSESPRIENGTPAQKLPTGTSLDDPSNFGLMPDNSLLENSVPDVVAHRIQLTKSLEFARNVLHTSKVPAAVWREWRNFERRGVELLKGEAPVSQVE